VASMSHWFLGMIPALGVELIHSEQLLSTLKYIPSDVDIWGALCRPFDMGEEYSSYFSAFLGIPCRLAYVNAEVPRYIQGPLPPLYCQQGAHPRTGLSDGAPYLYVNDVAYAKS
jgi:uncharacterized protein YcbX